MRPSVAQSSSCLWADPDDDHLLCRQQGLPAATDAWPCMFFCCTAVHATCSSSCGALKSAANTLQSHRCSGSHQPVLNLPVHPRGMACFLQLPMQSCSRHSLMIEILPAAPRSVACVLQVPGQRILQRGGHPQRLDPGPALPHDARRQSRVCGVSLAAAGLQSAAPSVVGGCCAPPPLVRRVLHYGKAGMLQNAHIHCLHPALLAVAFCKIWRLTD